MSKKKECPRDNWLPGLPNISKDYQGLPGITKFVAVDWFLKPIPSFEKSKKQKKTKNRKKKSQLK